MTFHSPELQTSGLTLREVERIRALVMNMHGMLRRTDAARLAEMPIEHIHRSLDLIEDAMQSRLNSAVPMKMSIEHY